MLNKNTLTKHYIRCIKDCFPIRGKQERQYLKQLEIHVEEFLSINETATYETLVSEFGSPTNIVSEYFSAVDEEYLFKSLNKKRYIRNIAIFVIFLMISYTAFRAVLLYKEFQKAQKSHIAYEITTIEETED